MDSKTTFSISFYTPQEIADSLRVNVMTVYEYIRNGSLSAIKIGNQYRISNHDFEIFLDQHKVIL